MTIITPQEASCWLLALLLAGSLFAVTMICLCIQSIRERKRK